MINRGYPARLVVGMTAGVLAGLAGFGSTRLSGLLLYLLVGAMVGGVAVTLAQSFSGRARLTTLTVSIPRISDLTFVVDDAARLIAWHIYVDTVTRVSVQPLSTGDGDLREALTSLHGLFASTRTTLKSGRPTAVRVGAGHSVEHLAVSMLNRELRPFLTKWHPRLRAFEQGRPGEPESAWPENAACRDALDQVRANVIEYAFGFARLAGVRDAQAMLR